MIADATDREVGRLDDRDGCFRFSADEQAAGSARDAIEAALGEIESGARLTVGLLTRTLTAICVRGDGGEMSVELFCEADVVRVEVSGRGPAFRLPTGSRSIDDLSLGDEGAPPLGWRSYLLDRLADEWGVDAEAGVAWFEVDHASAGARRLQSRRGAVPAMRSPGSAG